MGSLFDHHIPLCVDGKDGFYENERTVIHKSRIASRLVLRQGSLMRRDLRMKAPLNTGARFRAPRRVIRGAVVFASLMAALPGLPEEEKYMDIPLVGGLGPHPAWSDLDAALPRLNSLPFGQSWLTACDSGFQPGDVRVFRTETHLVVVASLTDAAAANPSRGLNAMHFRKGDVFEVFLKPPGGEAYWEIHVTPEAETYQVRIPSGAEFQARRKESGSIEVLVKPYLLNPPAAVCMARRADARPGWDSAVLFPLPANSAGEWLVSGCRYDHPGGGGEPVLSSISPLTRRDFHHQADWLRFLLPGP